MGLFSCASGQQQPSKKALIVELERKREKLQQEVARWLSKANENEAALSKERVSWTGLRSEYEAALQAKTAHTARLLQLCTTSLGETDIGVKEQAGNSAGRRSGTAGGAAVSVSVTAYEPDREVDTGADGQEAEVQTKHAAPSRAETLLEVAVQQLILTRAAAIREAEDSRTALALLQASQEQARGQQALMEQRGVALEAENTALSGLNTELQIQLERMQQQHSTLLSSGQESSVKLLAELQAKQQECLAVSADAEALRTQLHRLQSDLEDHERQQARQVVELQALSSSLTSRDDELQALAAQLAEAQQALSSTRRQLADLEPRAKLAQDSAVALEEQLQTTRSALVEAQHQASQKGAELTATLRALTEAQARTAECEKGMASAKAVAEAAERSLQDMTAQYVSAKRDLIAASKQMATVAQEHNGTLERLNSHNSQLAASTKEKQDLETQVQLLKQDSMSTSQRLRDLEARCPALESELSALRCAHQQAQQDLERQRSLLRGISRLSSKAGGLVPGQGQELDAASLSAFYETTVKEDCLRLKLCDMPLALCGPLFNAVADSRQLSALVLDMDSAREAVWEKAGLRVACLAAALGVNGSLRSVELSGWTWSELGNGCALPFLTLGSSGLTSLCTVKVDTKLFDVDCAASLLELLQCGLVQLKRPGGQGVLRLYADNEDLDEWYGTMIQDAVEPSWHQPLTNQALLLRSASSTPTPAAIPGAPAFGRSPSMAMSVASTAAYVGALGMGVGAAASPISRLGFAASPAPSACHTPGPVKVPAGLEGGGLMLTPGRQVAEGVAAADVPDALTDLSNKGLESHHMVVVMAVLVCCPHLKRLRLDGNKIGNAGAELLSLGLTHNASLRELLLSRNSITSHGAKRLARSLEKNSGLRRLDLSAQRFEGLGATGAEAVLASLRNNTTLEELSLSSNSLGAGAAAGLCAALRTAGAGSALKRLGVGHNGLDAAAAKALQEVAMERGLVITV